MTFFPQQGYQGYGSPESIARKRRLAEQLMQGVARTPRNVGEGLSALGNALAVRGINSRADEAEKAMREGFARDYGDIFNPQAGADVAGDTVAALGLDVQPEAAASPSYQRVLAALADPRGGASQRAALQAMLPSLAPMSAADKTKFDYMKMKDERDYSRDVLESDRTYGLQSSAAARASAAAAREADAAKWVKDGAGRWRNKETGEYRFDVPTNQAPPLTAEEYARYGIDPEKDGPYVMKNGVPTALRRGGVKVENNLGGETRDQALFKKLDEKTGEQWAKYETAANASAANMQDLAVLDELVGMAPQGPIRGRLAEAFPGFSNAGDAFDSIVKRMAPTLRVEGSGSTSDIEYAGMLRGSAALKNNPDANRLIIGMMRKKAEINVERGDIVRRVRDEEISPAEGRRLMSELNRRSIMDPQMRQLLDNVRPKEPIVIDGVTIEEID